MKSLFLICICIMSVFNKTLMASDYRLTQLKLIQNDIDISNLPNMKDALIIVNSFEPRNITIMGVEYKLSALYKTETKEKDCSNEKYRLSPSENFILHKNKDGIVKGITYIVINQYICYFEPLEIGRTINDTDSLMAILKIRFANLAANDKIIDQYGSRLIGQNIRYLGAQMEYIHNNIDTLQLHIKIVDESGRLLRNRSSPRGYTYAVTVFLSDDQQPSIASLGKWKKSYKKGYYRFEVYRGGQQLYTSLIPVKGIIRHIPVFRRDDCYDCMNTTKRRRHDLVDFERIYQQTGGQPGTHINGRGVIVEWRDVEK